MTHYSMELKTIKYVKRHGFLLFVRKYKNKYWAKD